MCGLISGLSICSIDLYFCLVDHFLKVFIEFVTIQFVASVLALAARHGIFAPRPGIEPAPPALEGEVLTTGPPGKSLSPHLRLKQCIKCHPCTS